jgi:hypothetical protein
MSDCLANLCLHLRLYIVSSLKLFDMSSPASSLIQAKQQRRERNVPNHQRQYEQSAQSSFRLYCYRLPIVCNLRVPVSRCTKAVFTRRHGASAGGERDMQTAQ